MRGIWKRVIITSIFALAIAVAVSAATVGELGANESTDPVSVIVSTSDNDSVVEETEALGGHVTAKWDFINAFAVEIPENQIETLATIKGVRAVTPNNMAIETKSDTEEDFTATLANVYNEAIRATKAWEKGLTGEGIGIAVIDSGVTKEKGQVNDFKDRLEVVEVNSETEYMADKFGHGTHVAGIAGGDGNAQDGKYIGVAPGADIISVKVSNDEGMATEEDIVNGLQWVLENKDEHNIRVVNISSQVATQQHYTESALNAAVEVLWHNGIVVVVSAGNRGGEDCSTCYAPANDPFVITVGALEDNETAKINDDVLASFSSYGETLDGFMKPEVMAPGSDIVSFMPSGFIKKEMKDRVVDDYYFRMSGTSMSAPMVAGAAAIILQELPDLTPDQVKWLLMETGEKIEGIDTPIVQIDKATAYQKDVTKIPSANEGVELSPFIDADDEDVLFNNISWSNISWSNISWSNISWSNLFE
ncbi:S8 family peptidase [Salirhabdus salicampi]|uniref:S8 family peptidase n=1 Tax=Salirhabdus salicampi TaxID=476102 RepID=UPI0020C23805|nr:S8 family peptidase [Salirhabdus salicampi]MCP8617329.1 S8 family peptidase [Salirhabdus salicampi]